MPQAKQTGIYDFVVTVQGTPASTEEYDEMAKQVGACLETAVDNDLQHIWKSAYRKALRASLEKAGIAPNEGEKDKAHYDRAKALIVSGDSPITMEDLVRLRNEVAEKTDYSTGGGSSSRIGQEWLNKAAKYLENITDPAQWQAFMTNITNNNPGFAFELDDDGSTPTQESIALALKTEDARVRAAAEDVLFG